MSFYQTVKITNDVFYINDPNLCTVYILIGEHKALIIDTGMKSEHSLLEEIKKITDKELIVVLTHGHYDHTGHIKEFKMVYMDSDDVECLHNQPDNLTLISQIKPLKNEMIFDLGNFQVKAIKTSGHTKGSFTFIDQKHHFLFTGDQFGSGCGVWMQVKEAIYLSAYIQSIDNFINYLTKNYNYPFEQWTYYGGHLGQEKTGPLGYNPLNSELVKNLKVLSQLILNQKIKLIASSAKSFTGEPSFYANYKNAEMVLRPSIIQ